MKQKDYLEYKRYLSLFMSEDIASDKEDVNANEVEGILRTIALCSDKKRPVLKVACNNAFFLLQTILCNSYDEKTKNKAFGGELKAVHMNFSEAQFVAKEAMIRGRIKELFTGGYCTLKKNMQHAVYQDGIFLSSICSPSFDDFESKYREFARSEEFMGFLNVLHEECPRLLRSVLVKERIERILKEREKQLREIHQVEKPGFERTLEKENVK